jgi:uncharacterized protein YjeT (DUF2065 family)
MRSHGVDADVGMTEFANLWLAETADELHQVLVLHPPERATADASEPYLLLHKHHETEPDASVVTAMLLLTDRRWRDAVGKLARRIEASGMLDDEELDLLAQVFLAAGKTVYWAVPADWLGVELFTIDVQGPRAADPPGDLPEGPITAQRPIVPPLRRWAATRVVSQRPDAWGAIWTRARQLDARNAAAVVAGLLDAIDALTPPAQELLIQQATKWPDNAVRTLGLKLLAARHGADAAYQLAKDDPNTRIRAWAESLVQSKPIEPDALGARRTTAKADRTPPPTLF